MKNKLSINELCYSTLSSDKPNSFDTYVSQGGYGTWKKIIKELPDRKEIINAVIESGWRGRGGCHASYDQSAVRGDVEDNM